MSAPLQYDVGAEDFADFLESVAPNAEDLIVLIKSYFDESYNSSLLCVAGYTFQSRGARLLDKEWRAMLLRYRRLPYFRMSACNSRQEPFDRLTESECIAVATEAIGLINKHAVYGYAITVDQAAFHKIVTRKGFASSPYELCCWMCLVAAKLNADRQFPNDKMSFIFEAGFPDQGGANRTMMRIFGSPKLRADYRYKSHSFIDKIDSCPTQASDLLAWQWYKDYMRRANGATEPRGDLRALLSGTRHQTLHLDAERLQESVDLINKIAGSPIGNEIAGLALSNPSSPIFPKRPGETGSIEAYEKMKKEILDKR
jgi:hypothetical protein